MELTRCSDQAGAARNSRSGRGVCVDARSLMEERDLTRKVGQVCQSRMVARLVSGTTAGWGTDEPDQDAS
jgi:hypothetical protein